MATAGFEVVKLNTLRGFGMAPQDSPFVSLLDRIRRQLERVLRPFEPILSALELILQALERPFRPLDRLHSILKLLTSVIVFIGTFGVANAYLGWNIRVQLASPDLPVMVKIVLLYGATVALVYLFVMFFSRGNRAALVLLILLAPIVGSAFLWFSLDVREFLFSQWLAQINFSEWSNNRTLVISGPEGVQPLPASYSYDQLCRTLAQTAGLQPELDAWGFLSLFQLHAVSATVAICAGLVVVRLFVAKSIAAATGAVLCLLIVISAFAMTETLDYHSEGPNAFGIYTPLQSRYDPITRFYRAAVDIYVGRSEPVEPRRGFWKFGCG